jgi:hypothetical protein
MQFHELISLYSSLRKAKTSYADQKPAVPWYDLHVASVAKSSRTGDLAMATIMERLQTERAWWADNRPYYNVWPVAVNALTRLRLDAVDCSLIKLPLPALLLRFAVGHEVPLCNGQKLRCALTGRLDFGDGREGLIILLDVGKREDLGGSEGALLHARSFMLRPGMSLEEALASPLDLAHDDHDEATADEVFRPAIRLICTLCLLDQDANLIEPDVLADDRRRHQETSDPALVAKAIRRGKRGWNVGAHLDASPHWRRPHFALRWTGAGRSVPKIVPVKGAIVKLHALRDLPTGRLDSERVEQHKAHESPAAGTIEGSGG